MFLFLDFLYYNPNQNPNLYECKESRTQFSKREYMAEPIIINEQQLEIVRSAKILGITLTDDLKWNKHIGIFVFKPSKILYYLLTQLQRAGVDENHLMFITRVSDQFWNTPVKFFIQCFLRIFSRN